MNFGDCPYNDCNELQMLELPDRPLPIYVKYDCDGCHRRIWYKMSRVDPTAWTEEQFLEEFEVNHETRQLVPKVAST